MIKRMKKDIKQDREAEKWKQEMDNK